MPSQVYTKTRTVRVCFPPFFFECFFWEGRRSFRSVYIVVNDCAPAMTRGGAVGLGGRQRFSFAPRYRLRDGVVASKFPFFFFSCQFPFLLSGGARLRTETPFPPTLPRPRDVGFVGGGLVREGKPRLVSSPVVAFFCLFFGVASFFGFGRCCVEKKWAIIS